MTLKVDQVHWRWRSSTTCRWT